MTTHRNPQMPILIRELYDVVSRLEREFNRKFTPDGHLVGSIGEVLGADHFDLELLAHSNEGHDARSKCGRDVEIKATQGKEVSLRSFPRHLLVLKLERDGQYEVIYNGPGGAPWDACSPVGKNGQRRIRLSKLRNLMLGVLPADQLVTPNIALERSRVG